MGALTSKSRHEKPPPPPPPPSDSSSRAGDGRGVAVVASSASASSTGSTGSSSSSSSNQGPPLPHDQFTGPGVYIAGNTKLQIPHKFHETVTSPLEDQAYSTGVYIAGKTKKHWVHEKTRCSCFMLFARALFITWGDEPLYWTWHPVKETNDSEVEAAWLQNVCWLEVRGKEDLSQLTPGFTYDVVFLVMLTEPAYGWSVPVNLRLRLPDGTVQERKEKLQERPTKQWLELKAGEVKAGAQSGELEVSLFEYGGHWKKGLLIMGVKIVAKE